MLVIAILLTALASIQPCFLFSAEYMGCGGFIEKVTWIIQLLFSA